MMDILRTPEERFLGLPDYAFAPHYVDDLHGYEGARVHYVDQGPPAASHVFLCLHGEPTWSYLYRKMIPVFTAAGHRAVAPDYFGFGKSDKPAAGEAYTFDFHREMLLRFIERLDLGNAVLVCQDWGGLLGLTLPLDMPDRFRGLLIMNTAFATGDTPLSKGFLDWRDWSNQHPDMAVGKLMGRTCPHLSAAECAAYDAPFPDARYKAGVRRFPNLVPDRPNMAGAAISRRARDWWRDQWQGKSLMAVGMKDPVLGAAVMQYVHRHIRDCPPAMELAQAGHFVPEWGEAIARRAVEVF
jgi:haloalkane dehalogenase